MSKPAYLTEGMSLRARVSLSDKEVIGFFIVPSESQNQRIIRLTAPTEAILPVESLEEVGREHWFP